MDKDKPSLFCSDLSFWANHTKNCISDESKKPRYEKIRHCDTYITDESNDVKITCNNGTDFFCPKSKTCIPKEWLCDGAVQCKQGEDEAFDICEQYFPLQVASITCIESYRPENLTIWIKAIPCDGIRECKDGSDEICEWPSEIIWITAGDLHIF